MHTVEHKRSQAQTTTTSQHSTTYRKDNGEEVNVVGVHKLAALHQGGRGMSANEPPVLELPVLTRVHEDVGYRSRRELGHLDLLLGVVLENGDEIGDRHEADELPSGSVPERGCLHV